MTIGIVAGAVVAVALGAWLPRDEGSRDDGGAIARPVLIATAVALALVARGFATLRIDVDASVLRARFGPFGVMLAGEPIGEARVVPYRCLAYGGWGLRYGRQGGRMSRAYSAPFVGTGVVVDTTGGRGYHLTAGGRSSSRPR